MSVVDLIPDIATLFPGHLCLQADKYIRINYFIFMSLTEEINQLEVFIYYYHIISDALTICNTQFLLLKDIKYATDWLTVRH